MKRYGLIGFPLSHSFSKEYFTDKFLKENIDAAYELFPLSDIQQFTDLIPSQPDLCGLNVTIPYKQSVIPFLDALDFQAKAIGAVNVIRIEHKADGSKYLKGYNSDVFGFRESIRPFIQQMKKQGDTKLSALVLGSGGASKAVVYGLEQLGISTHLVSRTPADNQFTYSQLKETHYQSNHIIVNTTPLGMHPNVDACPDLDYSQLGQQHLLFDLVYNPQTTAFLKHGEAQGCMLKNGLEMLHLQADGAWKIWNEPQ